jgi:hypothetical protein
VDQHRGQIEVLDRPTVGTCFRVILPHQRESVRSTPRESRAERPDPRRA